MNIVKNEGITNNQLEQTASIPSTRVVMIIVDSLMNEALEQTIKNGKAPAFEYLINKGHYYPHMVTSYPTMSVVIDSTLLTGTYADQHKIPALVWFDSDEQRFISYGSAAKEIMKLGGKQVLLDSVFHLNHKHLSPKVSTIHEEIGDTASINTLVYRGNHMKPLNIPKLLNVFNLFDKSETVQAPSYFSYGLLSILNPENKNYQLWQALGFNDKFATSELKYLIKNNRLPSYSLVYLSDNDKKVHKNGALEMKGIEEADQHLQEILNMYPSWDEAIQENVWIVMGDSGQTDITDNKEKALIDLRELLQEYQVHKITEPIQTHDQIVLGLNERMTFIYLLDDQITTEEINKKLLKDERIDHLAWKEGELVHVQSVNHDGKLSFKPEGPFIDQYEQTWTIEGNTSILDLSITEDQFLSYDDYPDGLARLYSAFHSHSGRYIVADAKPGYEFIGEGSPRHVGGGSHGSLHKQDTFFPMIVVGTNQEPKHQRMIDLKEWILRIIGQNNEL
ncbi:alkaline phosphatase family protein [Bacillus sp. PS06]|nr:alkaline phosphatase family protein [Bacillus sp. PS06]